MVSAPTSTEAVSLAREPRRLHALFVRYPVIAGAFTVCVGLIVLVGWAAQLPRITHPFAHVAMMVPHTAALAVLTGIALALSSYAPRVRWARSGARIAPLAVALLAGIALVLYVTHVTVNGGRLVHRGFAHSPYSAITFALLATALLARGRTLGRGLVSDYLAIAVIVIATGTLLGYLFEVPAIYRTAGATYIAMSPITAALAFVLGLGVMTLQLERGVLSIVIARDAGGVVARQLLLGLAVFPPLALIIVLGTRAGWYALPLASALVLLLALGESSVFALRTAQRLSRLDDEQRRYSGELRASDARNAQLVVQAFEAERQARTDLESIYAARSAIAEAVASLTTEDIQPVLAVIAEQARSLTRAELAAVGVGVDPTRAYDYWVTTAGSEELLDALGDRPRPIDVLGLLPHHPAVPSFLATPITRGAYVVGMLYVANKHDGEQFTDRDGRLVGLLADGVALAIEAARGFAAEAAQRLWLQSVIDQIPEGVAVLDAKGAVYTINRTAKRWASALDAQHEVGALAQFDLLDMEGNAVPLDEFPVVRALRTGGAVPEHEYQLRRPDGQMFPIEASAAPVLDTRGNPVGAVAIGRDISERKELERLRDEWIAVVAHDLRQPIHTIVFSLELLTDMGDETRRLVARLQNTAFQLNRMIDDLLDAARISANRLTVESTLHDLVGVVNEAIDRIQMTEPTVSITLDAPDELTAWFDPGRIQQVLDNLLSNAVKYRTPDTEVRVEVRGDETGVEVAVINEGPTLDAEDQQRIFGRFVRARSGKKKSGIGLGLYICKGLVEAHGGEIGVTSEAGRTRFAFTLPARPVG